ncbi:MAG: hypothetical protein ACKVQT_25865 [Burkholderiales bacterium]
MLGNAPAADEARFLAERLQIRLTDTPAEAPVALVATQGQGDDEALEAALRNPAKLVLNSGLRHGREHVNPTHIEQYEGVSYYFCCEGCRATFR